MTRVERDLQFAIGIKETKINKTRVQPVVWHSPGRGERAGKSILLLERE